MAHDIRTDRPSTGLKNFLSSLVQPLQTMTNSLNNFEDEYRTRAKFNGQKIVLQAALNEIFGISVAPFILVETVIGVGTPHFKVKIPTGIHTAELERRVKAETTLYKLAGKVFTVETYV